MPVIHVEMFKGRNQDTKRELARELTEAFTRVCGGNADAIHIVFQDVEKHDWARGGELMSDKYPD